MSSKNREDRTICIAFADEGHYGECMSDQEAFRRHLASVYEDHPELFPAEFGSGYKLHGFVSSKKQGLEMRRLKLLANGIAYQVRPSFMMPYMIGETAEVEKGLYLLRWGVPFEALAYVFGRDAMYWYRAYLSLGRYSVVGTTLKDPSLLPGDVLGDEKHTWRQGEKLYVTTTVAQESILGADIADAVGTEELTEGFQQEAHQLDPEYAPETVNTDGWDATQQAWLRLFPTITIVRCFLHAWLKIARRTKRNKEQLCQIGTKVWHAYHAPTLSHFAQRIRRLREWAVAQLSGSAQDLVLDLCHKAPDFKIAFAFPHAYRTSNALDRLMNYQDRLLYAMQYFHASTHSARLYVRSMALLWNFHPYGRSTQAKYHSLHRSPMSALNGFSYHDNWLQNLLIAGSLQRHLIQTHNPL